MATQKEEHKAVTAGFFYACCPYCKVILLQGQNGTNCFIKCPQCGKYIHIVIDSDSVLTKRKEN